MDDPARRRILSPMAAQLCHLLLALQPGRGICQALPNLRENAEKLAQATEELAAVARRLAQESGDEVCEEETRPAAESLVLAGRRVLLAAGELQGRPHSPRHREQLAAAAKRLLAQTVKILRIEDAAGARRVTEAASWLLERLSALRDAGDTPGLLAAFRAFSEALLLLGNLTAKRLEELGDCPRQKSLARNLQLLQKCVPLLHAAKRSDLKCSWDRRVKLSKDSAFQLTERTIKELVSLLVGTTEPRDRAGTFSQHVSELLALLSHPRPRRRSGSELSAHVDAVVFYCVLLADASRADLKLELVKRCWVLLQLRKSICSHTGQQEGRAGESSLEKERRSMREELETLDRAALTATLCQILDTFGGEEPLRPLVEAALHLTATGCFPAGPGGFLKQLQPLTATFFTHAQRMLRVTDFVLARCAKTQTAREIGEGVNYLQSLLARLPALLAEMSRDTSQASAAERLRSLYRAWAGAREGLLRCFEETVGVRELLELSVREMAKDRERCDAAWERRDHEVLRRHAAHLCSWARWVVGATARHVDRATDPVFRNGLLVWVRQLASSIPELEAVAACCPEGPSCLQTGDVFSRAASGLVDAARRVCDGLDGTNHPDILSPLRARVRSADAAKGPELSPGCAGLKTITGEAVVQEDIPSPLPSRPGGFHPDVAPRQEDVHPVIAALLAATRTHDTAAVDAACSALLELSGGCVAAAKDALPVAEPPQTQALGQHQTIVSLTPHIISLAKETAPRQLRAPSGLFQTALTLSERIRETKECLAAVAGPWYSLAQQVFGFFLSADFVHGKQALEETMTALAGTVQFAGDVASVACSKGNLISPDVWETFLEVQAKFSRAQMTAEALLEKAASCEGSCGLGKAGLELRCVRWAVSTHVLLRALDRFIGGDVLLLGELSSAVHNKLCSQSLLAAVSEISLRLQEAARLSALSCPEERGRSEILALREEVEVLVEALLDASSTLSLSPLPRASLTVRWELLQRDLALRAKALLLHLENVNAQQLRVIRDVIEPALSLLPHEDSERRKDAFEEKASRLMTNIQRVKTTLRDTEELHSQEKLLSVAEHLLLLTSEAVGSARWLLQSHGDKGHPRLASTLWYWAAMAHYLLTQLRATRGPRGHILQLIGQCLCNAGDHHCLRPRGSTAEMSPALSHLRVAGTCPSGSRGRGAAQEAREMQNDPPSISLASGPAKYEREDGDKMSQVTKEMATRMLHMTQFLRRKGPIVSKDQLISCARQIASDGQAFVKFGRAVAKHCPDARCRAELLCAAEHTHTLSSQLGMVARVKAVTADSKSSSELLVSNARNLLQAVLHVLKAAEAACVKVSERWRFWRRVPAAGAPAAGSEPAVTFLSRAFLVCFQSPLRVFPGAEHALSLLREHPSHLELRRFPFHLASLFLEAFMREQPTPV
ncbi:uncharacterized protein LOC135579180 isoform X3 [Columba livia]